MLGNSRINLLNSTECSGKISSKSSELERAINFAGDDCLRERLFRLECEARGRYERKSVLWCSGWIGVDGFREDFGVKPLLLFGSCGKF